MPTPKHPHASRKPRRVGITALALCAALLAPAAQAQLVDWAWKPTPLTIDMAVGANWLNLDTHQSATSSPNASVRGQISQIGDNTAQLYGPVTLGSLSDYLGLILIGRAPGAALILGNDQGSAGLMIGSATSQSTVEATFADVVVSSAGAALIHADANFMLSQTTWAHQGELVIGASSHAGNYNHGRLAMSGSTLGPGFGELDIVIGSAGRGGAVANYGSRIDATSITVGGSTLGVPDQLIIGRSSTVTVQRTLQIGRANGGVVKLEDLGDTLPGPLLQADRAVVGFTDGLTSQLNVGHLGRAEIWQLAAGQDRNSDALVTVASGGQLIVGNQFTIGGEGSATVTGDGYLQALNVSIGSWQGGHMASLTTRGTTVIGDAGASSFNDRVQMNSHSQWTTEGRTDVHGSVTAAMYGGANVGITVGSTGVLHIDGRLSVGDYHHFDPQPIGQRVVVMPGGRLEVGDRFELYATAQLSGGGTVVGNLFVTGGTVAPGMSPGHLTIDGDLRLSGGVIVIELGGLNPGTEHDVLEVQGTLTLGSQFGNGATLVLEAVNGFAAQAGQGFDFLRAGQIDGSFSALVDHTGLGLTLADLQFADGHIGINLAAAVPEPHAALLLLLGLIALRLRHRRAAH